MRNFCKKLKWDMCCLDATGSTNQYRWLLYSIIISDEGGHGIPLAFMITSWESHEPIVKFLEVLHITNSIAFSPKVFMIDKSDTEILAINTFYKEHKVLIFLCFFHYMQAWERWCRNSANEISLDARLTVIAFVRKLKLAITIEEYNQLEQDFIKWILVNNLTKLLSYYKKEWQSCHQLWANVCKPKFATGWMVNETNNLIERFFSTLKWKFLHGKKNKRIDTLINILINQCSDFFTIRFDTQVNQQVFNEKKFNAIKSCELKAREIAENNMIDIIDPMYGYYQSSLLCKHIRAAARILGGLEIWNLSLDSERVVFY
ncbi:unnamed protein product [Rhizophagus irregularis]|nr:unnamed protein product [Rhizophagus irregularis]